jgi:hypothetical protein
MRLPKFIPLFIIFLFSQKETIGQQTPHYDSIKNKAKIGIYLSPKVTLHTKLITDIAHFYVAEEKRMEQDSIYKSKDTMRYKKDGDSFSKMQRVRHDTADVFDRVFFTSAIFIGLEFNKTYSGDEKIDYNDTLFMPFTKVEQVDKAAVTSIIKRDSLDYCITINNLHSIAKDSFYTIEFIVSIYPKENDRKVLIKKITIPFTDQQKKESIFFSCSVPFECLIANTVYLFNNLIIEKLYKDGYRKKRYEQYKKEGVFE